MQNPARAGARALDQARTRLAIIVPALLSVPALLGAPSTAQAQDPDTAARETAAALARIPPGSTVRIQTRAGDVLQGTFRLAADSVLLGAAGEPHGVALGDVRSAWYQVRTTRTGAITGAVIGAGAGGALMGLLALVASGSTGEKVTLVSVGLLGGAAAGGVLGGVVGAAIPRWVLVHPAGGAVRPQQPAVTVPDEPAGRRRLGSLEASLGYGLIGGDEPTGGGPGGRLALYAELGADPRGPGGRSTFVAIGPEAAWFDLGETGRIRRELPSGETLEFSRRIRALTAGGSLRGGLESGVARTWVLVGLAYNRWEIEQRDERWIEAGPEPPLAGAGDSRFEHLGYTAGAGAQIALRPFTALGLELRRTTVGTFDMDVPGSYWSVTISGSRRW